MTKSLFDGNPAVRIFENIEFPATVQGRDIPNLPHKPFRADAHIHSFTRAFGPPEQRTGAWLTEGAAEIDLPLASPVRATKTYYVRLTAMLKEWRRCVTPCTVTLNDRTLFSGDLFLENVCRGWPAIYFRVPPDTLVRGKNRLRIKKHGEPEQTLIVNRVDLMAYEFGHAFGIVSVPTLAFADDPFVIILRTPDIEATTLEAPPGWTQVAAPFRIFDEPDLFGFTFKATHPGLKRAARFKLGRRTARATVALVSDIAPERLYFSYMGDDTRQDHSPETRMVLAHFFLSELGDTFTFRASIRRNFFHYAPRAEVDRWLDFVEATGGHYLRCVDGPWLKSEMDLSMFDRKGSASYLGKITHEPYIMIQRQWQTPAFRRAKDVVEATAAYKAHIRKEAQPKGTMTVGEPSMLAVYIRDAGFNRVLCETACSHTLLTAAVRGACRDRNTRWGYHLPPDWYFGQPNDDKKVRRLACALYSGFIAGADFFELENSLFKTNAHTRMDIEHPHMAANRRVMREFRLFARLHPRRGRLVRRVAALFGNCNSAIWLHDNVLPELRDTVHEGGSGTETGSNWAEPVWCKWPDNGSHECMRATDVVSPPVPFRTRIRSVLKMFSGTPYGQFDVIQADHDHLGDYPVAFYTGFNLMMPSLVGRLERYVRKGGILVLAAAHLNTSKLPKAKMSYLSDGKIANLLGLSPGARAKPEEIILGKSKRQVSVLPVKRVGAAKVLRECGGGTPWVTVNRLGKGRVIFFNAADYVTLFKSLSTYKSLVRTEIEALAPAFGIRGTKKIFYGLREDGDQATLQLLNTDWDNAQAERFDVVLWREAFPMRLDPCAMAEVQVCPLAALHVESPFGRIDIRSFTKTEVRFAFTGLVQSRVRCFVRNGRAISIADSRGNAVAHSRYAFSLPPGASEEYILSLSRLARARAMA